MAQDPEFTGKHRLNETYRTTVWKGGIYGTKAWRYVCKCTCGHEGTSLSASKPDNDDFISAERYFDTTHVQACNQQQAEEKAAAEAAEPVTYLGAVLQPAQVGRRVLRFGDPTPVQTASTEPSPRNARILDQLKNTYVAPPEEPIPLPDEPPVEDEPEGVDDTEPSSVFDMFMDTGERKAYDAATTILNEVVEKNLVAAAIADDVSVYDMAVSLGMTEQSARRLHHDTQDKVHRAKVSQRAKERALENRAEELATIRNCIKSIVDANWPRGNREQLEESLNQFVATYLDDEDDVPEEPRRRLDFDSTAV